MWLNFSFPFFNSIEKPSGFDVRAFCMRLRNKAAQVCLVYPNTAFHFCQVYRKLLTKEGVGLSSSKLGCALSSQCELLNEQDRILMDLVTPASRCVQKSFNRHFSRILE